MNTRALMLSGALLITCGAFASPITYNVVLDGPSESPPQPSPGIGSATVIIDLTANTLSIVSETFSGLLAGTTASHLHCCAPAPFTGTAGVATQVPSFTGFPLGVTSGTYSMTFDMTQDATWNPAFISASGGTAADAEAALAAGAAAGLVYLNIHSTIAPGGEIRGFLVTTPEPGALALAAIGMAGIVLIRRRR